MDEPLNAPPKSGGRRRRAWQLLLVTSLATLLALFVWATVTAGEGRSLVAKIAAGKTPRAPDFSLEVVWPEDGRRPSDLAAALADGELSLSELAGRPVVLNFWASWCIPCRDEAPILNASARRHFGEVTFVGINVQDLRGDALGFLREFKVPYVAVRDRADDLFDAYGLTGIPETFYLDARGRIVAHTPGAIRTETLEQGITKAITGVPASR